MSAHDSTERRIGLTGRAMEMLAREHLDDDKLGQVCLQVVEYPSPPRDTFLRAVYGGTKNPTVRARACLALAEYLKAKGEMAVSLMEPADWERMARLQKLYGTDYFGHLRNSDPGALFEESGRLYERVLAVYAGVPYSRGKRDEGFKPRTLVDVAEPDLYELRNLTVGKSAPEIEGEDLAGKPIKLSDHRGKVVVLTFWGTWCGPCMSMVPLERSLLGKYEGKPFALLGVNSDEDSKSFREILERERITWPSWRDGGRIGGPIATRWNVKHWPTIYVLDPRGVIRFKLGRESPEGAVDQLMRELAAEGERTRRGKL